jgi:hypothetical protein
MASKKPLFMNPKPAAAERLPALSEDPETGTVSPPKSPEISIKMPSKSQLSNPESYTFLPARLGVKSQGGKSRKHKKRNHKKTQKRRAKK